MEPDGNGGTRLERLRALADALGGLGAAPRIDVVPGVAHEKLAVLPVVRDFLREVLAQGAIPTPGTRLQARS